MRGTLQIGRVMGIPIGVHFTWLLPLSLVLGLLATRFYPQVLPDGSAWQHWALASATGIIFFTCIVLHELGHSVVARYFDIPVHSITLFMLGGVAQITREAKRPGPELLMALAGPAVSILLGGVFMVLWLVGGQGTTPASMMWEWLWIMNLGIGLFNLVPAFPMDGGRVLRAGLWRVTHNFRRATRIAVWVTRGFAATLIAAGILWAFETAWMPFQVGMVGGLQFLLIGWFLLTYAAGSLRQSELMDDLSHHSVRSVMLQDIPAVYGRMTVEDLLSGPLAGYGSARDWAFVSGDERFLGVVPRVVAAQVPEEERASRAATDVMVPAAMLQPVGPDDTLEDVFHHLQERNVQILPVVEEGQVIGLIHGGMLRPAVAGGR
jgi:Zn-dependent protease